MSNDELTAYFHALEQALTVVMLKTSSGTFRKASAAEFMYMGKNQDCLAFKHSGSRNYIYLHHTGDLYVPQSDEPFHRGFFDLY
ncbi:MAG: hypothetical protein K2X77_17415 [Candidatus Obscuribacterales bacterium]|nr:hypothetical protein [Candidatus Obscuribacterales bacterium]